MTEPNGFYYMRARYYDPEVGRFVSEDPIGLSGGLNLYAYTSNNPILFIDPVGFINFLVGGGGSAVASTGVEGSTGIVFNPGIGDSEPDIGIFGSAGVAAGVNVSSDVFVGFIKGDIENVSGETANVNVVIGPLSVTAINSLDTGEFMGLTVGIGPSAMPFEISGSISETATFTVGDLISGDERVSINEGRK